MATDYWLAAISVDVDQSWRPPPWTSACGWRPDPWTSMSFTRNTVNMTVELSSFGRPKEEKLKPPSLSAARGCYNNVVKTLPWAQGVNEVNQQPIITNERPATSASLRRTPTVDTGTNDDGETDRLQPLFWRSRWDNSAAAVLCVHVDGKRSCHLS
ncbi:hypothetical protein Taro_028394, partial [Colocasia esculenta]|nr:hypothetical protein [Colocasia esculenta]